MPKHSDKSAFRSQPPADGSHGHRVDFVHWNWDHGFGSNIPQIHIPMKGMLNFPDPKFSGSNSHSQLERLGRNAVVGVHQKRSTSPALLLILMGVVKCLN